MSSNGHKVQHRTFPLTMRKCFLTVKVTELWHRLPRQVMESLHPWRPSKAIWARFWVITSRSPCLSTEVGPDDLRRSLLWKPSCNSVKIQDLLAGQTQADKQFRNSVLLPYDKWGKKSGVLVVRVVGVQKVVSGALKCKDVEFTPAKKDILISAWF